MSHVRKLHCFSLLGVTALFVLLGAASVGATCEEGEEFFALHITPRSWTFNEVDAEKQFTIKNEGNGDIKDLKVKMFISENEFKISGSNCGAELQAGKTCEVTVKCKKLKAQETLEAESKEKMASDFIVIKS